MCGSRRIGPRALTYAQSSCLGSLALTYINCWPTRTIYQSDNQETVFLEKGAVLQHTTEHCLMGIKGMVKRAEDVHFIHANCDTDVIVSEEPPLGSTDATCGPRCKSRTSST